MQFLATNSSSPVKLNSLVHTNVSVKYVCIWYIMMPIHSVQKATSYICVLSQQIYSVQQNYTFGSDRVWWIIEIWWYSWSIHISSILILPLPIILFNIVVQFGQYNDQCLYIRQLVRSIKLYLIDLDNRLKFIRSIKIAQFGIIEKLMWVWLCKHILLK